MMATIAVRALPRPGPALRRAPVPVTSILVSTLIHVIALAAIVLTALWYRAAPTKTYIVNLVPAIPAVGTPQGKPAPPRPPRPEEPPPRASKFTPAEVPSTPEPPTPVRSTPVPDLPSRTKPLEMPTRERPSETTSLPERPAPPREVATPRPGQKELPAVASAAPPRPLPAPPTPAAPPRETAVAPPPPPPPPPLGRPTGTAQGTGAIASAGGDFPFAWYLRAVERKVYANWEQRPRGVEGQHVVVVFEIGRDGQVSRVRVEQPSGDALYDQAALRAVTDANPLPQLPPEFKESILRVHFGFTYSSRG